MTVSVLGSNPSVDPGGAYIAAAGSNRLLVWQLSLNNSNHTADTPVLITGATFGGVAMTVLQANQANGTTARTAALAYLLEADILTGSKVLAVTTNSAGGNLTFVGGMMTLGVVDQSAPIRDFQTSVGVADIIATVNLSVEAGDFAAVICQSVRALTGPAGYTALYAAATTSTNNRAAHYKLPTLQATESPTYSLASSGTSALLGVTVATIPPPNPTLTAASLADPLVEGTAEAFTGTNLEPASTNVTITFGQAVQTVTAGTDTTGAFTCSIGTQLYGNEYELVAENSLALQSAPVVRTMNPPAGQAYFNCPGPLCAVGNRLTAPPLLIAGCQIHVISATGGAVSAVTINPDGSFTVTDEAITAFLVRGNNNDGSGFGASASQAVVEPAAAAPTFDGPDISNIVTTLHASLNVDVSGKFTAVTTKTYSTVGAWPPGISVNAVTGHITGTVGSIGLYTNCRVRVTNVALLTVDSNAFTFTSTAATATSVGSVFRLADFSLRFF